MIRSTTDMDLTNEKLLDKIASLNEKQKKDLNQYLTFSLVPDLEVPEFTDIKYKIYKEYNTTISTLIAKIEVYTHDLPRPLCGMIETIFRLLASSTSIENMRKLDILYNKILIYEFFIENKIYLMLTDLYVKNIKSYKKTFRKFKHGGIKIDDKPFMKVLESQLNEILKLRKKGMKRFKKMYSFNKSSFSPELKIKVKEYGKISELYESYISSEKCLNLCEQYYSEIINNGYVSTLLMRFISYVPTIIATFLAIFGIISMYLKYFN